MKPLSTCVVFFSCYTGILPSLLGADTPYLGNIAFVGDSITERADYRKSIWKSFLDNGYQDKTNGTNTAAVSGSKDFQMVGSRNSGRVNSLYQGQNFIGMHEGHASWYSGALIGDFKAGDQIPDYGGTRGGGYIRNWVSTTPGGAALDTTLPDGWKGTAWDDGSGHFKNKDLPALSTYKPDTIVIMVGINDHFGNPVNNTTPEQTVANIKAMVEMYREANPNANFYISTVLPVDTAKQTGRYPAEKKVINDMLMAVGDSWNNGNSQVKVFDGSIGFDPVTMTADGVHPEAQGSMIFANNLAEAMGTGQRTAGKARVAVVDASKFIRQNMSSLPDSSSGGSSLAVQGSHVAARQLTATGASSPSDLFVFTAPLGSSDPTRLSWQWSGNTVAERTLEVSLQLTSGVFGNQMTIGFGNTSASSGLQLDIRENGVFWGNTMLYGGSQSAEMADFRIAYIASGGVAAGYYVWRNGMLIGEALSGSTGAAINGFYIGQANSSSAAYGALGGIYWSETGAWAPDTLSGARPSYALPGASSMNTWTGSSSGDWGIGTGGSWSSSDGHFHQGDNVGFSSAATVRLVSSDIHAGTVSALGNLTVNTNGNNAVFDALQAASGTNFTKEGAGTLTVQGGSISSSQNSIATSNVKAGTLEVTGDTEINIASGRFDVSSATLKVSQGAHLTVQGVGEFSAGTWTTGANATNSAILVTGEGSWLESKVSVNLGNQKVAGRKDMLTVEDGGRFSVANTFNIGVRQDTDVTVRNGGVLVAETVGLGHSNAVSSGFTSNLYIADGGTVEAVSILRKSTNMTGNVHFDGGTLKARQDHANMISASSIAISAKGGTVDTNGFNVTIAQAIVNESGQSGALNKTGKGTLTLSAASTYSGGTTVNDGTLIVAANGATGSGSITVKNGSILLNNAQVGGSVQVESGTIGGTGSFSSIVNMVQGNLQAAANGEIGTIQFNSGLVLGNVSCMLDIATAAARSVDQSDMIRISGTFDRMNDSSLKLVLNVLDGESMAEGDSRSYKLFDMARAEDYQKLENAQLVFDRSLYTVDAANLAVDGTIMLTREASIPEPSAPALGMMSLLGLMWKRRRKA